MTVAEFKSQNPLQSHVEALGAKMVKRGADFWTNVCPQTTHKESHQCVAINPDKQVWRCHDCQVGGDIIRWMAMSEGKSDGDILKGIGASNTTTAVNRTPRQPTPRKEPEQEPESAPQNATIVDTYEYRNALGDLVYEVVRLSPKSFRQRHKGADGKWVWNMTGVERVLYRLPEVLKAATVAICEGEKDTETLVSLGYCATCNVGGAGKWMDGYTESLAGKDVLIFGDNDKAGQDHVKLVFDSIAGKAKSVKIIKLPDAHKDVTDFVDSFSDTAQASAAIANLVNNSYPFIKGVAMPLFTMAELENRYREYTKNIASESFSLGKWLPSFNRMRRLVPGELVAIVGNTGVGKTALLQNIALAALPLPTLLFELELPSELLFERFVAARMSRNMPMTAKIVEDTYSTGDALGEKVLEHEFNNLFICDESNLSVDKLESIIVRSELKIGTKPKLVLVDYMQLLTAKGESRYDRASNVAESLKRIAKSTGTIIITTSQRSRPTKEDDEEITLHSAKESGSIENSVGLLIGAWRDQEDPNLLTMRILKSTKGGAGMDILCNFNGETMRITERAQSRVED